MEIKINTYGFSPAEYSSDELKPYGVNFEAPSHIDKRLQNPSYEDVSGTCIIDNVPIEFYFVPPILTGYILTDNPHHRTIIKHLIPLWYIEKFNL
jgi:hypothetical protein